MIGINAQIKSESGGGEGVGFAIPVDAVDRSLRELREDGRVEYGYLGVTTLSLWPQLARRLDLNVRDGGAGAGGRGRQPGRGRGPARRRRRDRVPGHPAAAPAAT